ncbi:PLDc N-terminal domain-containing protein [Actinocatenispora sera]|uniref:Cardiolipin synthase N-terminal domain-containing protein n=1 Tax=Actinocatenispora sera TaxID=390989 RepID=A0A810L6V4_9ACTN|nr:PLDc N-terminal domain-containing protein [Actinocatenispora sera]BCJ31244.1 hypothetical protein Asera_53520 [Actinocatenispora sera]
MCASLTAALMVAVVAAGFAAYCVTDLARADERDLLLLPRMVWVVICVRSVPIGGLAYLLFGRRR